jgi:hypothetical protein
MNSKVAVFFNDRYINILYIIFLSAVSACLLAFSVRSIAIDVPILITYIIVFVTLVSLFLRGIKTISVLPLFCSILTLALLYTRLIYYGSSGFYTSAEIYTLLAHGIWCQDTSFHLAIVEAIKQFGFPSTAIHGIPYLAYHFGSHYFLAGVSFLSGVAAIELFPYQNTFFASLTVAYFFGYRSLSNNSGILGPLSITLLLVLNMWEQFFWVFDISTPIALFFGFLVLTRIDESDNIWIESLLVGASLISKISVGIYVLAIYLLYKIFFTKSSLQRKMLIVLLNLVFLLAVYFLVSSSMSSGTFRWEYNSLYSQLLAQEKRDAKIYVFFAYPFLVTLISLLNRDWRQVTAGTAIMAILFLAINISFINRSHMHFVRGANLISAFILAGMTFRTNRKYVHYVIVTGIVCFAIYTSNYLFEKTRTAVDNLSEFSQKTDASAYIKKLFELRERRGRFLVYIPEAETDFWNHWAYSTSSYASRFFMPFWIPMISGKPAFRGYNPKTMESQLVGGYPPGAYGYNSYYRRFNPCSRFDYIIKLSKIGNEIYEQQVKCDWKSHPVGIYVEIPSWEMNDVRQ